MMSKRVIAGIDFFCPFCTSVLLKAEETRQWEKNVVRGVDEYIKEKKCQCGQTTHLELGGYREK